MSDTTAGKAPRTPPYVSWLTTETFIRDLHEHGVPSRIDRSVLVRFSGTVRSQLQTALKFLGLIGDDGEPTNRLRTLADAYGTPLWKEAVRDVIREEYGPIFTLDLETATPSHFNETFKAAFPGSDAVLAKCQTFFLNAAKAAEIKIGPRLLKGKKPRGTSEIRKRSLGTAKKKASGTDSGAMSEGNAGHSNQTNRDQTPPPKDPNSFERELLAKFPSFDPAWSPELQAQWFQGFQQFMTIAKGSS